MTAPRRVTMSDDNHRHLVAASAHSLVYLFDDPNTTIHNFETLPESSVEDFTVCFTIEGDD